MMLAVFVSAAFAGTIRIHSTVPVSYRLDGQYVGRVVTDVTLTDVPAGAHSIEVVDTFGTILASTAVVLLEDVPLWFDYVDHRLFPVDRSAAKRPVGEQPPITDAELTWVETRIARKRKDEKRLKRLGEVVEVYWFQMRHVDSLLLSFQSLEARVMAARMLAPRTIDPQKTKAIEDHFPPGSFRDRALEAFAAYQ
jgi:hypothetical protein